MSEHDTRTWGALVLAVLDAARRVVTSRGDVGRTHAIIALREVLVRLTQFETKACVRGVDLPPTEGLAVARAIKDACDRPSHETPSAFDLGDG